MKKKIYIYINGDYPYCKIIYKQYMNDIFYYEFCSSAQRSNIKSRLTSSLFGHLQIILGQISIKIFHRRYESEWLPRHTRPRRYFHCIIFKNYFISHKKFNGDWEWQLHTDAFCDTVSSYDYHFSNMRFRFTPLPPRPPFVSFKRSVPFCEIINRVYFVEIT